MAASKYRAPAVILDAGWTYNSAYGLGCNGLASLVFVSHNKILKLIIAEVMGFIRG